MYTSVFGEQQAALGLIPSTTSPACVSNSVMDPRIAVGFRVLVGHEDVLKYNVSWPPKIAMLHAESLDSLLQEGLQRVTNNLDSSSSYAASATATMNSMLPTASTNYNTSSRSSTTGAFDANDFLALQQFAASIGGATRSISSCSNGIEGPTAYSINAGGMRAGRVDADFMDAEEKEAEEAGREFPDVGKLQVNRKTKATQPYQDELVDLTNSHESSTTSSPAAFHHSYDELHHHLAGIASASSNSHPLLQHLSSISSATTPRTFVTASSTSQQDVANVKKEKHMDAEEDEQTEEDVQVVVKQKGSSLKKKKRANTKRITKSTNQESSGAVSSPATDASGEPKKKRKAGRARTWSQFMATGFLQQHLQQQAAGVLNTTIQSPLAGAGSEAVEMAAQKLKLDDQGRSTTQEGSPASWQLPAQVTNLVKNSLPNATSPKSVTAALSQLADKLNQANEVQSKEAATRLLQALSGTQERRLVCDGQIRRRNNKQQEEDQYMLKWVLK